MEQFDNHHHSKKLKKETGCSSYDLLPEEIKLDILSRLSCVNSVLDFKRVCKNWQTLLSDPCFLRMHFRRSKQLQFGNDCCKFSKMSFLFSSCSQYIFGEYDENNEKNFNKTIIRSKPIPETIGGVYVAGSYDGLVLSGSAPLNFSKTDLVVSNPVTREYVNLPSLRETMKLGSMVVGFGYDSSTSAYKVIRINYPSVGGQIYIYTLGQHSSGWRHAGTINYCLKQDPGVLANGALHWLERNNGKIFSFGMADEKFRELEAPLGLDYRRTGMAGVKLSLRFIGGWLCLEHKNVKTIDIWALKKETTENHSCDSHHGIVDKQQDSWNWTKEFCVVLSDTKPTLSTLDITKSGELVLLQNECLVTQEEYSSLKWSNNEVSLLDFCYQQSLVRYNPNTKVLEKICDTVVDLVEEASFFKSLISLKELGEEDAKRM